jgi:hypothetical protein
MKKQNSNKIKKTIVILLAVCFVVAMTAASASACTSKDKDGKCTSSHKEKVCKKIAKPVKETAKVKVVDQKPVSKKIGNNLLDFVDNNWWGNGCGTSCVNGLSIYCTECWFSNDWNDCWNC